MIIFINGSINAGKSTVAKILAEKIDNSAVLEIDALRDMIRWMPIDQAVPINLENAVSIIKNFCQRGLNVIVPYPLSQKNYHYIADRLKDIKTSIYYFTLAPKIEAAMINRGNRELSNEEIDRIKYHYSIGIPNPQFGKIIDNTNQSPDETVKIIIDEITNQ